MLIDTHAHLYFEQFEEDREQVIQRALQAGVEKIINIAVDLETAEQSIRLAEAHSGLFAAVGIHPNDASQLANGTLAALREYSRHPKVVAIGEIGLDFYRDRTPRAAQERAFRQQISLARQVGLPIVIHNRQAIGAILDILRTEGTEGLRGVFHCFSESAQFAEQVLEMGFHISFTGNLTFKKSELPAVAQVVPLERLLLETDSPFLSPEPKRGRRNEPARVLHIARKLAEIKGTDVAEIERITTENAVQLFGLGAKDME
ncbi:MAG: TatD family hydrolase [bacterium]